MLLCLSSLSGLATNLSEYGAALQKSRGVLFQAFRVTFVECIAFVIAPISLGQFSTSHLATSFVIHCVPCRLHDNWPNDDVRPEKIISEWHRILTGESINVRSVTLSQACSGIGGRSSKSGYWSDSGRMEEQSKFDSMRRLLGYTRYWVCSTTTYFGGLYTQSAGICRRVEKCKES